MIELNHKCSVCGRDLKGVPLSMKQYAAPLDFPKAELGDSGVRIVAFKCGQADCSAWVCHDCIAQLDQIKPWRFALSKEPTLKCPECSNPFGEKNAELLIEGWAPNIDIAKRYGIENDCYTIFYERHGVVGISGMDEAFIRFPDTHCCLCMREASGLLLRKEYSTWQPGTNKTQTRILDFNLCHKCFSVLSHPKIKYPGHPYTISAEPRTRSINLEFANTDYMELVIESNPSIPWRKG